MSKFLVLMFLLPTFAFAEDPSVADLALAADTLWVLMAAIFVFFMQAGFAMFEMGLHAAKNTVNVLMKNVMDFVIASICFIAVGFALMFGDGNGFIGTEGFFLKGNFSSLDWTSVPLGAKFFFQLVFAGTAATIVSGAIGGRVKFSTYIVLSIAITALVYPILGHWVWGGGWLSAQGFFDFAGSTVVHGVGGFAALAAAIAVGPRIGRFNADGSVNVLPGHNLSMVGFGVLILWLGWFGFNPGSTMAIVGNAELVSHIFLTTNIAAAAGAIAAMTLSWTIGRRPDVTMTLNGVLAGLVSVTASCAFVTDFGALIIGAIGGVIVFFGTILLDKMRVDDSVGAFPVHGMCGIWGTIALGLFAAEPWAGGPALPSLGLLYGGGASQLIVQVYGTLAVCAAAFGVTYLVVSILKPVMGLRVSRDHEIAGLDLAEHGQRGYYHELFGDAHDLNKNNSGQNDNGPTRKTHSAA
jgi:Amt family ammonium transporter